tara:strand:+ start:938 stop:1177 length:240 start_codon:yes stop_codon:yes gene_type:complete
MYFIIMAAVITVSGVATPVQPSIMASYVSLDRCLDELVLVSKLKGYKRVVHPMFGNSVVQQYSKDSLTLFFCAKDKRSL